MIVVNMKTRQIHRRKFSGFRHSSFFSDIFIQVDYIHFGCDCLLPQPLGASNAADTGINSKELFYGMAELV